MSASRCSVAFAVVVLCCFVADGTFAQDQPQSLRGYPFRIVDADGKPVAGAKVDPWALRSSQGHGSWSGKNHPAGIERQSVVTDSDGNGIVQAPIYANAEERVKVIDVTISIDHPDHPGVSHVFLYPDGSHVIWGQEGKQDGDIRLPRGGRIAARCTLDGKKIEPDRLRFLTADYLRSPLKSPATIDRQTGDCLLPVLPPGPTDFLAIRIDENDLPTHFSKIIHTEVVPNETTIVHVAMKPAIAIEGELSSSVPRPVKHGRVVATTLPASWESKVTWEQSTQVDPDGRFKLKYFPPDESIQITACCRGYIASRGEIPEVVEEDNPYYLRAHCFAPESYAERLLIPMETMNLHKLRFVDPRDQPVVGLFVGANPNVGWWNNGSTIYCGNLRNSEDGMKPQEEEYDWMANALQDDCLWAGRTDASGVFDLHLPADHSSRVEVFNPVFELPVNMGIRSVGIKKDDGPSERTIKLQYKGDEFLGEWDKLAGIVFGCGTYEGRRLCALPGVQEKMDDFYEKYREAKSMNDPEKLAEAYSIVAEGFELAGEENEAKKWREKVRSLQSIDE